MRGTWKTVKRPKSKKKKIPTVNISASKERFFFFFKVVFYLILMPEGMSVLAVCI